MISDFGISILKIEISMSLEFGIMDVDQINGQVKTEV